MIIFGGKDLEEIAPVKIEDIRVNPVSVSPTVRQRVGFGQDFIRMTGSTRTVTVTFALLINDLNERYSVLKAINEWAKPFQEQTLILPMNEGYHLDCRCTGLPEPSYRQWWESKLRLVFTTFDNPFWTSDDEIKAQCGVKFAIGGNAVPLIRIERKLSGRASNQTYSSAGRSMFFEQIPSGNLVIDLNRQTAEVSGTSIMKYFSKTSKFILPTTGNVNISGTGNIFYRERWL